MILRLWSLPGRRTWAARGPRGERFALLCVATFLAGPVAPAPVVAQERRPLELEDYYRLKNAGSPALSPDGSRVAYVISRVVEEENRRHSEVWLANADGSGEPVRLTSPSFSSSSPEWTPDGRSAYGLHPGRKSSKVNKDCTICVFCLWAGPRWIET